jgi:hypothetical protein
MSGELLGSFLQRKIPPTPVGIEQEEDGRRPESDRIEVLHTGPLRGAGESLQLSGKTGQGALQTGSQRIDPGERGLLLHGSPF